MYQIKQVFFSLPKCYFFILKYHMIYHRVVTGVTRRGQHMKQELLNPPEHQSSSSIFSGFDL